MGNAMFIYGSGVDEGTAFPASEREITYLYREPPYVLQPETWSGSANTSLVGVTRAGNLPSIFEDLEAYRTQCNAITAPSTRNTRVVSGFNNVSFINHAYVGQWTWICLYFGYGTSSMAISGFKLIFADNTKRTVKEAVENGYLSVLCLLSGMNWDTLYSTGNMATRSYPINNIVCKPILVPIIGVEFTASNDAYLYADGFFTYTYSTSVKFSLTSISQSMRVRNMKYLNTTGKRSRGVFFKDASTQKRVNL
jgi:hypothetical protein